MDLVVHQVEQLQDVRDPHRDGLLVRLAVATVVQHRFADVVDKLDPVLVGMGAADRLEDLVLAGTVEHRGRDVHGPLVLDPVLAEPHQAGPAQVRLEHLPEVHPGRDAERVQDDVDGAPVGEERHVLLRQDRRDHALVPVAAGELVAVGDLALLRHVDTDQLVHTRRQLVAVFAREHADADHLAALAVRDLERGVAHFARLLAEDRAEQSLLRGELGLALGRDLADEVVAGVDLGADPDDPALVEVLQDLLGHVGDVAGDLLGPELGVAGVDLVLLDVDRGQDVVLDQPLGDDDRVLVVVALPRHVRDDQVATERELARLRGRSVGDHLVADDLVALVDQRLLVERRALVGPAELLELVGLHRAGPLSDHDVVGRDVLDGPGLLGQHHVPRVDGGAELHAGPDDRGLRTEQGHGLALHVGAHQGPVRVVVLQERDQGRPDRDDPLGRDVHVVDLVGHDRVDLAALAADQDGRVA